jgi:hypothetical protein
MAVNDNIVLFNYFPMLITEVGIRYQENPSYFVNLKKGSDKLYFANVKIIVMEHPFVSQLLSIIMKLLIHRSEMGISGNFFFCITVTAHFSPISIKTALEWAKDELLLLFPNLNFKLYGNKLIVTVKNN